MADVLQQLGIMERPLNERSLEERDPASLTHEEVLELLRRTKEVVQQQEVVLVNPAQETSTNIGKGYREAYEEASSTSGSSTQSENVRCYQERPKSISEVRWR